jgi:hypothetical protein
MRFDGSMYVEGVHRRFRLRPMGDGRVRLTFTDGLAPPPQPPTHFSIDCRDGVIYLRLFASIQGVWWLARDHDAVPPSTPEREPPRRVAYDRD